MAPLKQPTILRKFAAMAVLLALLGSSVSVLTESLSAAGLPACCNATLCPMHQGQYREVQKEMSDCDTSHHGTPSSMQACDPAPNPAMQVQLFVLLAPTAIHDEAIPQTVPSLKPQFSPFAPEFPLTPPPRTLPS